jgi:hypothetical protein
MNGPSDTKKTCFVIAPIGDRESPQRKRTDRLMKYIVEPTLSALGFEKPTRSDLLDQSGIITNQIVEHLERDDLVVADMTDLNANVFYEIAARHVIEKPIVHLIHTSQLDKIPFDVNQIRAVPYDLDIEVVEQASKQLTGQVQAWEGVGDKGDNPLSRGFEVAALRRSGDPAERRLGELGAALDHLSGEVRVIAAVMADGFARMAASQRGLIVGQPSIVTSGYSGGAALPSTNLYTALASGAASYVPVGSWQAAAPFNVEPASLEPRPEAAEEQPDDARETS